MHHINNVIFSIDKSFGDKCVCYACRLSLDNWKANDQPWEKHAKYSRNCSHVILRKGHHFIKISNTIINTRNQQTVRISLIVCNT